MIPIFLNTCDAILMILELTSQEVIAGGVRVRPCWQGKTPEVILPVKTRHVNSFIITAPSKIYFTHVTTLFLCLYF